MTTEKSGDTSSQRRGGATRTYRPSRPSSSGERRAPRSSSGRSRRTTGGPSRGNSSRGGSPKLRIIPLGGLGEVGRNTLVIEYGRDIIVMDMGFMFPREDMPGIDYVLADVSYLEKNKDKIRAIVLTHGHMDHMGGIPYFLKKLGNPPIYGTKLTLGVTKDRLTEFNLDKVAKFKAVHPDDTVQLGVFKLSFFRVNHNIPDSVGVAVKTPVGTVIDTGDWKFDHTPQDGKPTEFGKIARLGQEGVLLLCSDSTGAEKPGYALSEKKLQETMELLFNKAKGRIIFSSFSTLISRLQQVINASHELGRKVAISGMSMEKMITTAVELGFMKVPRGTIIKLNQIDNYPDNKITVLCAGAQGQANSALGRMAHGEHRQVKIRATDTVVISASPIPGNERAAADIIDLLLGYKAKVIYSKVLDIHSSGHGQQEEHKLMLGLVKPKYFMPIHGERHHLVKHAETAEELGWKPEDIFIMGNGDILEINKQQQARINPRKLELENVLVDGLGVGDVGNVVLRDRQVLAEDGMMVIIATVDRKTGKLRGNPDIISRGFIYVKSSEDLIRQARELAAKAVRGYNIKENDGWTPLRAKIRDDVGKFLLRKTERQPMILPVILQV